MYIDVLNDDDLLFITQAMYPMLPIKILNNIVSFNKEVYIYTSLLNTYASQLYKNK